MLGWASASETPRKKHSLTRGGEVAGKEFAAEHASLPPTLLQPTTASRRRTNTARPAPGEQHAHAIKGAARNAALLAPRETRCAPRHS
jgi:hypothetical protein